MEPSSATSRCRHAPRPPGEAGTPLNQSPGIVVESTSRVIATFATKPPRRDLSISGNGISFSLSCRKNDLTMIPDHRIRPTIRSYESGQRPCRVTGLDRCAYRPGHGSTNLSRSLAPASLRRLEPASQPFLTDNTHIVNTFAVGPKYQLGAFFQSRCIAPESPNSRQLPRLLQLAILPQADQGWTRPTTSVN